MAHSLPEFGNELGTVNGEDGVLYSTTDNPMIEQYGSDVRGSRFTHRDGTCQLAVSVGDDDYKLIVVGSLGECSK